MDTRILIEIPNFLETLRFKAFEDSVDEKLIYHLFFTAIFPLVQYFAKFIGKL